MLILLLTLLLIAVCFVLKELVVVRRQVSSMRQFLEWTAVGLLENGKDTMNPAMREYMENTKMDLIREGLSDGTLSSEQQVNEVMRKGVSNTQVATVTTVENTKVHVLPGRNNQY